MNQLKSGTLIVIALTVVTAILMLITDRQAPSIAKSPNDEVETLKTDTSTEVKVEDVAQTETKKEENIESVDVKNTVQENHSNSNASEKTTLLIQKPEEIAAPEGPYNQSASQPVVLKTEDISQEAKSENTASVITTSEELSEDSIMVESINDVATSTQHEILDHLVQPIWMDQKLGDFKSAEKSEVFFQIMPTSPDGLQGVNPQQVVTEKNDKFAISADYNYQQMPMYNGGYYIAPMPPYLMESMLPMSEAINNQ